MILLAAFDALRRAKPLIEVVEQERGILNHVRETLSQQDAVSGAAVRAEIDEYLAGQLRRLPMRGKRAALRPFVEHLMRKTASYAPGLFHCYDDPRIPRTTNGVEGLNGQGKRHVRKVTGRKDTSGGEAQTAGPQMMQGVNLSSALPREKLRARLASVSPEEYRAARRRMEGQHEPTRKYRSYQRAPEAYLGAVLEELDASLWP